MFYSINGVFPINSKPICINSIINNTNKFKDIFSASLLYMENRRKEKHMFTIHKTSNLLLAWHTSYLWHQIWHKISQNICTVRIG